jgi:hypothetical protein
MTRKKSINPVFQKAVKWLESYPTRPDNMTDEQIRETDLHAVVLELLPSSDGDSDYKQLALTREFILEAWKECQENRYKKAIAKVFAKQADAITTLTVKRDEATGLFLLRDKNLIAFFRLLAENSLDVSRAYKIILHRSGKYDMSRAGRLRFSHKDYALLIGQGSSQEVRLEMAQLFKDRGLSVPGFKGGFLLAKTEMRNANKNGVFELVISEGDKGNALCSTFGIKLYQYLFNEQDTPVVCYPPASGDKLNPVITDQIHETTSMSCMMKDSILAGAQTPAVVFRLVEAVQKARDVRKQKPPKGTVAFG